MKDSVSRSLGIWIEWWWICGWRYGNWIDCEFQWLFA